MLLFWSHRINKGKCEPGWVLKGKWGEIASKGSPILGFFVYYLFPISALIYYYGKVIQSSRRALKQRDETTSAATQKR